MPFRTAQRWVSRYRRFGLAGLARAGRTDRGKHRRLPTELCHLAEGLALQRPPLRPGAIYREVCRVADDRGQQRPGYRSCPKLRGLLFLSVAPLPRARWRTKARPAVLLYRRRRPRPDCGFDRRRCADPDKSSVELHARMPRFRRATNWHVHIRFRWHWLPLLHILCADRSV